MKKLYDGASAVVSIADKKHKFFFIQQKDETYWIKDYRLKYCYFGGGIEVNEDETNALERELKEEFNLELANKIFNNSQKIFDVDFINHLNQHYYMAFFESLLPEKELINLSKFPVKEGKGGFLIKRKDLTKIVFMGDIARNINKKYFKLIGLT